MNCIFACVAVVSLALKLYQRGYQAGHKDCIERLTLSQLQRYHNDQRSACVDILSRYKEAK